MPDSWDFNQTRSTPVNADAFPIITYLLIFLCVLFTAACYTGAESTFAPWHSLYLVSQVGTPGFVWSGHYWVYLVSLVVHANPVANPFHILFNMIWLYRLGTSMERSMNPFAYIGLILAAGIVSGGCEIVWTDGGALGIGFSGVVYAMFGLVWMGRFRNSAWKEIATDQTMRFMIIWALGCWVATYFNVMQIANGAHFGGFAFGLSLGWLVYGRAYRPIAGFATAAVVAVAVLGTAWMPWCAQWLAVKGDVALEHSNIRAATAYYQQAMARHYEPKDPSPIWIFIEGGREYDRHNYIQAIADYQICVTDGFEPSIAWGNIAASWRMLAVRDYDLRDYASYGSDMQHAAAAANEMTVVKQTRVVSSSKRAP